MGFTVDFPERLDRFLTAKLDGTSRSHVQKLIEQGAVSVNDEPTEKPAYMLSEGDTVEIEEVELSVRTLKGAAGTLPVLEILYEDEYSFVVNKPAGISVHPAASTGDSPTLLHALEPWFKKNKLRFNPSSVLAHRLDKETTGCVLIAKNSVAHQALQKQFADRTVSKQYLALVSGIPEHEKAVIDAPIGRSVSNRTSMDVRAMSNSREAKTSYEVLGSSQGASLLLCTLHTGRTHQLRVHLKAIGHPILGDDTYTTHESKELSEQLGISDLCLHAWKLEFDSLEKKSKRVKVEAELPGVFAKLLKKLKFEKPGRA